MGEIRLLDPTVANQIAAGEVVTRPAAVVKELLENAVDAGAQNITMILAEAGEALICITDDGCGISPEQVPLAFARHATSKIRTSQDIFKINTLGFRGEALASIASVAEVEMKTRTADSETGVRVHVKECRIESTQEISMNVGTSISVYNLFYNTPARRKFLKSDSYEKRLCLDEFEHVALANPAIGFTLQVDNATPIVYPPCPLHDRVKMIAKKKVADNLFHVSLDTDILKIEGWTASPSCQVQGNREMYFFVNGRYMNPRFLYKAVSAAYGKLLPEGRSVPCYLYLQVSPDSIDVNVHPTKAEIKFDNEREIWDFVRSAVKRAVGSSYEVPELDFSSEGKIDIPVFSPSRNVSEEPATTGTLQGYNPFDINLPDDDRHLSVDYEAERLPFKEDLPSGIFTRTIHDASVPQHNYEDGFKELLAVDPQESPTIIRLPGKYFAVRNEAGLVVIHYGRAQERIEYERILTRLSSAQDQCVSASQRLLVPKTVSLAPSDAMSLLDRTDTLFAAGFEIGDMGGGTIAVYAVPLSCCVEGVDLQKVFDEMADEFSQFDNIQISDTEKTAMALAKSYAFRKDAPADTELIAVARDLFSCSDPKTAPSSALPTMWVIPITEIDKHFKQR